MPTNTPNLQLPKPLGTEYFNRTNYNALIDAIEANAAKKADLTTHVNNSTIHVTAANKTAWDAKQAALPIENRRKITYGTAAPTGGVDGDIYFQYE